MSILDKVREASRKRGVTMVQLESDLDFPKNSMYKWENSKPSIDRVEKVADYLGVSVDYLLGRTDIEEKELGVSAHKEGEDWTPEELDEIEQFKEFVRSKRNNQG